MLSLQISRCAYKPPKISQSVPSYLYPLGEVIPGHPLLHPLEAGKVAVQYFKIKYFNDVVIDR